MKNIYKLTNKIVTMLIVLATLLIAIPACNDNPDAYVTTAGTPEVSYVRIPDALSSDSLVTHAYMGTTIALIGNNLTSIKQLWFNDQQAVLNTSLIKSTALIVSVPNTIPQNITNTMYLINSKGDTVKFNFKVDVPNPLLTSLKCEYVPEGGTVVIKGNYFLPVEGSTKPEVYFTPNIQATEIVSYSLTEIQVKVPAGADVGPISVKSRYGTTRSDFRFRDNTNLICDFKSSTFGNPWGLGAFSSENPCSGQYLLFQNSSFAAWSWLNNMMFVYSAVDGNGNNPIATGDISKLALRFEANIDSWSDEPMCIWFSPYESSFSGINVDASYAQYHWKPYLTGTVKSTYKSDGWETYTIPLSSFNTDKGETLTSRKIDDISKYTNINLMLFGAADATYPIKVCIDNLRVVSIN